MPKRIAWVVFLAAAGLAAPAKAWGADAPPPPAPVPAPAPAAGLERQEYEQRAERVVEYMPEEMVVVGTPLRLDGPIEDVVASGPLALEGGPVVPITAPGARDVLSPRRVREYTPTTVEEIANRLPGVSSRLYSGDEYMRPSISLRGMPDNGFTEYTAVLVDGMNMSTLFYGWTAISIFPLTPERVWAAEVYRGAHAVRYGPNTIGGIVNFVTLPIPEEPTLRERLVLGSNAYWATATDAGGTDPSGRFGALLTYVQKGGDTWRDHNEFDANEIALKTIWNIDEAQWLSVNGAHWRAVHGLPGRLTRAQLDDDPSQNPNPEEVDWHGWAYGGTATYHRDYGGGCRNWYEAQLYYRKARRALDSPRPANPPYTGVRSADSDNYNEGVELRGEFSAWLGTEHRIHWGARYHYERIDRVTFDEPLGGGPRTVTQDAKTVTHALSANVDDTVKLGRWTLQAGLRGEWIPDSFAEDLVTGNDKSFDFSGVFPGASVVYEPSGAWAVFGNLHTSFRAPQTWSYDFSRPDQDLDFENGLNMELGARWRPRRGVEGSLVLWQVDFSDFIELDPQTQVVTNYGGYRSRGVDLVGDLDLACLNRRLAGLSLFGNLTWQTSEFTKGQYDGNNTQHVPDWVGAGGVRYEHAVGAYAVADVTYRGWAYATPDNQWRSPDYALLGGRVGWRKEFCLGRATAEIDVALGVKNALDYEYHLQHNATQYVPGTPREFFLDLAFGVEF
jgi:Fe(3+) dicitrate transport protein